MGRMVKIKVKNVVRGQSRRVPEGCNNWSLDFVLWTIGIP